MANFQIAKDIFSRLKLIDGHEIPWFGLGTYKSASGAGGSAEQSVAFALQNGCRLIDTAQYYQNEEDVGRGIKKSGIPREEVYVVTKLMRHGYQECKDSFMESLKKLNTGYVDLFLIHSPSGGKNVESYKAMMELQRDNLIRSIGVSNFGTHHLEELRKAGLPTPSVNQIELHPCCRYEAVVQYCRKNGIALMGFSPLARGQYFDDPALVEIAKRCGKSPAQVLLRWSLQSGFITIPKSEKTERVKTNADLFDFNLRNDDMEKLNSFPPDKPCTGLRLNTPWEG